MFLLQDSLQEKLNEKMFNYIPVSRGSVSSGYSKYPLMSKNFLVPTLSLIRYFLSSSLGTGGGTR